jgi:betaine reductase
MVGSNRIVLGNGIVHVVGDANLSPEQEKELRRKLVRKALDALQATVASIPEAKSRDPRT